MNNRKVIPMSERLQIVSFLLWKSKITSTIKIVLLSEIIYGAKGSLIKLTNSRKTHDFCSRLLKISNYSMSNERPKKDAIDILAVLSRKNYICIENTMISVNMDFDGMVGLRFLSDELAIKLNPFAEMTDESFLEEVIKYAKD